MLSEASKQKISRVHEIKKEALNLKMTKMISRKMAGGMLVGFLAVAGIVTGSQGSMTVYAAEELQGSGTADDPYVITGSEDLWQFAEIVKASSDRNQ